MDSDIDELQKLMTESNSKVKNEKNDMEVKNERTTVAANKLPGDIYSFIFYSYLLQHCQNKTKANKILILYLM